MEDEGKEEVSANKEKKILVQRRNKEEEVEVEDRELTNNGIHLMPFSFTSYNGPAKISNYMIIKEFTDSKTNVKYLSSSFRGREIRGSKINLDDYALTGILVREDQSIGGDDDTVHWKIIKETPEFFYWNLHDQTPGPGDRVYKWLKWTSFSKEIHRRVTPEEIEKQNKIIEEEILQKEKESKLKESDEKNDSEKNTNDSTIKENDIDVEMNKEKDIQEKSEDSSNKKRRLSSSKNENNNDGDDVTSDNKKELIEKEEKIEESNSNSPRNSTKKSKKN